VGAAATAVAGRQRLRGKNQSVYVKFGVDRYVE